KKIGWISIRSDRPISGRFDGSTSVIKKAVLCGESDRDHGPVPVKPVRSAGLVFKTMRTTSGVTVAAVSDADNLLSSPLQHERPASTDDPRARSESSQLMSQLELDSLTAR
ncbi:hypothetical protein PIB30_094977, partial [Stylosanthes scabra]|nr:hypothetical protein [Stylosanthes scabra]